MSEARNVFTEVCVSCVLIGIGILSVISLAILIWTQVL
jgi:hypothetical protein